jgi:hypothetical protein
MTNVIVVTLPVEDHREKHQTGVGFLLFTTPDRVGRAFAAFGGGLEPARAVRAAYPHRVACMQGRSIEHRQRRCRGVRTGRLRVSEWNSSKLGASGHDNEGKYHLGTKPAVVHQRGEQFKPQLYNLAEDRAETHDLLAEQPEVAERLARLLDRYRAQGFSRSVHNDSGGS